jgi:hypothetical protein
MNEIIEFIKRRWQLDSHWLDGNCYWFAHILTTRFTHLDIYYLPIEGHFVAGDGKEFYDWTGLVALAEKPWLFSYIRETEPNWYSRIVRDCIM